MKLARFGDKESKNDCLGVVIAGREPERILDVARVAQAAGKQTASTMMALIETSHKGMDALRELVEWASGRDDPSWTHAPDDIEWMTPVPPRSLIGAGRNFGAHRLESIRGHGAAGAQFQIDFPTGFVKLGRVLVPHKASVRRPEDVLQFDYEVEIAVVIGKSIERANRAQAADAIFGYTIFNDLSAREWQLAEMKNQLVFIGKNFPGFGPIGPYILTADEVPDPRALTLWLKVNGELRQHSDCRDLIFEFDQLVEFWSRVGLTPGDIISSGTPEGVALHRKPDPTPFYLKPGDIVHAGVDQIGVLETRIV